MSVFKFARFGLCSVVVVSLLIACESDQDQGPGPVRETVDRTAPLDNPIDSAYDTPFGVPPFHKIRSEHFRPALESAIEQAENRLADIADSDAEPDFDNTVRALEEAGRGVARIARLWYGMTAVGSESANEADGERLTRLLSEYEQRVLHDRALFERIKQVRNGEEMQQLDSQQRRLVEETWRRFRRAGALLDEAERNELAELDRRIAELDRRYARTRRSATHRHELFIEDETRLSGLPESLVLLARQSARDRGHAQGWAFTLHAHSFYPFMRHFEGRDEREQLYRAWMTRYQDVTRDDEDLGRLIERLAELRAERASLLGFDSHLDYLLDDAAISNRAELETLLDRLSAAAQKKAEQERERLGDIAAEDGIEGELQPWDWWYYRERLIESTMELEDYSVRRWFEISQVRDGLFTLANRLWGLTFHRRSELPTWHLDVSTFEVRDPAGSTLGLVYFDPTHRSGKQGGAWTSHYRVQRHEDGDRVSPVAAIVTNVTPPAADMPALLSPQQVRTQFHEFGHALHSLFSDVEYAALAGTNVPPDFVEFPALLLERWALEPEMLRGYARHHETGNLLDDSAIDALQKRAQLTAGLETLELLAAIELDLALHGASAGDVPDLETAERRVREKLELPAFVSPRHHGGGLASLFASQRRGGDFQTLWSELLAADAFAAFKQAGLTNRELAEKLRDEVLSRGNSRDPMDSWQAFRGRDPQVRFLLTARGLDGDQSD
ncbi:MULTISPECIES: M3 family metallopeptidase [unclassified Wenzhouxiangella]|uniref:M3 family metallopeptidase n=1 Tax=unclassified Wenzhouxiangella TaxID=2613841 RepID=UPI000E32A981|nr:MULTISPECIES: M3 family metallopeptidase [unclassified Wenzhouxiangella]RFF26514.1 hypothetical protein DZK25_12715 [Wenzhouxiangella sp. 15181]RFP69690.1 hypothetical protein DZK26_02815 [Wenzhouxiangella sp. 15190]